MKKPGPSVSVVPGANVEAVLQDVRADFELFCLTARLATSANMMEEDASRLCGPRYGRADGKGGYRWGKTKGMSASTAARWTSNVVVPALATVGNWPWRVGKRPLLSEPVREVFQAFHRLAIDRRHRCAVRGPRSPLGLQYRQPVDSSHLFTAELMKCLVKFSDGL